jgi:hypothetical protein
MNGKNGRMTIFFVQQFDTKAKLRLVSIDFSSEQKAIKWATEINALSWKSEIHFLSPMSYCVLNNASRSFEQSFAKEGSLASK